MSRRIPLAVTASFVLASFYQLASAQVTVQIATAPSGNNPSTNCTATTDSSGLQLVPGSTDLKATGVVLTPNGCGGGTPADFGTRVSVPANAPLNTPFNVTWTATQDAAVCTFGGAASAAVSGWAFGGSACNSSSTCAGTHIVPVTVSASGTYSFNVTCTNASGFSGSEIAVANTSPPSPANFQLTAPASATVAVPFSVSWAVTNAATCTGTFTGPAGATLTGWTGVTTPSSPRGNIIASAAGTYVLSLVCANNYGQVTSQPATVTVGSSGPACVAPSGLTRQVTADIGYGSGGAQSGSYRRNVDVTQWNNVWGYGDAQGTTPLPWPGITGSGPVFRNFNRTAFVGLHFNTGSTAAGIGGNFVYGSNIGGPNIDMSISTRCGDFTLDANNPKCLVLNSYSDDSPRLYFQRSTTNSTKCNLLPNTDYFLNIKYTDPTSTVECLPGVSCPMFMTRY